MIINQIKISYNLLKQVGKKIVNNLIIKLHNIEIISSVYKTNSIN